MQSGSRVYMLYCEDGELGDRLELMLGGMPVRRVSSRDVLLKPSASTYAIVLGVTGCFDGDIQWLRSAFGPLSPPRVVVAPLSVDCLERLYPLRSVSLQIVWADEGRGRLIEVLGDFRKTPQDSMWRVGVKLTSDYSFRPSVKQAINRACGLQAVAAGIPFVPEPSVSQVAGHVGLAASTLSQYWKAEVPLRCSLKELLSWSVVLWALRAHSRTGWNAIAEEVGLQRRSLERTFLRTAGCTPPAAAEDPDLVVRRFEAWVDAVWDGDAVDTSREHGSAPAPVLDAEVTRR